jgi:hypothetical protein
VLYSSIRSDPQKQTKVVDAGGNSVPKSPDFGAEWEQYVKGQAENDFRAELDVEIAAWRRAGGPPIRYQ